MDCVRDHVDMCDNLELPGIASFWHDGLLTTLKENEDWEIYLDRTLYLTIPKGRSIDMC